MSAWYHKKKVKIKFSVLDLVKIKVKTEFFGMFLACHVPPAF